MKASKKETMDKIGSMMLSGWKLLNDSCPLCHTALLSKSSEMRCPQCDLPVKKVDNELEYYEEEDDIDNDFIESFEETKKLYDEKNRNKSSVSAKLGEKMLSGWTLLADTCPQQSCEGTPLMKLGKGPMLCVSCGYSDPPVSDVNNHPIPPISKPASDNNVMNIDPRNDSSLNNNNNKFHQEEGDASVQIGRKLLMGWTLLADVCTSKVCMGGVPLMMSKEGQLQCVQCGWKEDDNDDIDDKEAFDKFHSFRNSKISAAAPHPIELHSNISAAAPHHMELHSKISAAVPDSIQLHSNISAAIGFQSKDDMLNILKKVRPLSNHSLLMCRNCLK